MNTIFLGIVIFLCVLAIFDLVVGVSNDAVNFLNSAIGAKVAKFRTIVLIAAVGVFAGAAMSNGMMEIARHGIFRPEQFFFEDLMWIFLGVMITDIVLLDIFNSLGMPTSTTVSMVFELLGGTFMLAIVKLINDPTGTLVLADLVNGEKALSVIIGIFVSVAIAFTFGALVQYLTRLLFSFNYQKNLKYKIGIFGGLCATAIIYFMLIKGVKDLTFMTADAKAFINGQINEIKEQVGGDTVILGLSGGVDSTVTAVLINKAIGNRLQCIFVDHGLLRKNEFEDVLDSYKEMGLNVIGVHSGPLFLKKLEGVTDPEAKRKAIGSTFIEVFDAEAQKIEGARWLAQGTIYPDVIESVSVNGPSCKIKSHHNVGGLPDYMKLQLVEPLRSLFKDEVRRVGRQLGIKEELIGRHPFPGPGLAIRILGEVTPEKVEILQNVDDIFIQGLRDNGLYDKVWLVTAPIEQRLQRNRHTAERAVTQRLPDPSEADATITNDSSLESLYIQIDKLI